VRRLNAVTRKLQKEPKKMIFPAMTCSGKIDLHSDSGYRRLTGEGDDEVKGYGIRGLNVLRRGKTADGKDAVHLVETICKSHRLQIRSSYAAETLAAAHGVDDAYPTMITIHELNHGVLTPEQLKHLREYGGLLVEVTLTTDAESLYKSLTSKDLKVPTEKTLLGHVSWIREMMMMMGLIHAVQWCDTRDMTADGHTKGSVDRHLLLEAMSGRQVFIHQCKTYSPYRGEPRQQF
jgi:hypothetical protein